MEQPAYYPFKIRAIECDLKGHLGIPALANMIQEAAWQHATQLGVSTYSLMDRGLTWVLSRFKLQVWKPLVNLTEVTVKTWPAGAKGLRAYRGFQIHDSNDELLATAESVWLILDIKARQVQPIPDYIKEFGAGSTEGDFNFSNSIPAITTVQHRSLHTAGWFDLDINKHVNNNHYIRWLIESLPYEFLSSHQLEKLEIVYKAECLYNDKVEASSQSAGDGEFIHSLIKNDTTELIRATTSWMSIQK